MVLKKNLAKTIVKVRKRRISLSIFSEFPRFIKGKAGRLSPMKIPFTDYHILAFLKSFSESRLPLDLSLNHYFRTHKSLGANDRRTIGDTVYGMIRWQSLLEIAGTFHQDQLEFYRDFEKAGFVPPAKASPWAALGTSKFLYERLFASLGDAKGKETLLLLNEEAPMTVRANLLKTSREHLFEMWKNQYSIALTQVSKEGIQFGKREPLFSLPEFKNGLFEVQDEGSQVVAKLVKALPGQTVLDFCSGSGGKTLAFAPSMQGKGQIYLHDIRESALVEAKKRLARAGIQNAQCLNPGHSQLSRIVGKCHWVLVDVPCSGTGTLRRNPDQKWKIDAPMIERLVLQQREIFKEALEFLHPKGNLVYATCSILPEENEKQVEYFLATYPIELVEPPLSLLPQSKGMDGFFGAVFRKKATLV